MCKLYISEITLGFLISLSFLGVGCKKFVVIDPPSTQIVTASVFNDNTAATAAVTTIYSQMQSDSWSMSQNSGLLSDELVSLSTDGSVQPYYINGLMASSSSSTGPWKKAYSYIYQANAIIEGLAKGIISISIQKKLTGEAKFIRAFWNFYLVNCYGDVPLVTTTDYTTNATLKRTPKALVYQQIVRDLKDAQSLLDSNYIAGDDTTITVDRIRPTKWAATALLARAYLYNKDYANAEMESNILLSNDRYTLVKDLGSVFLANNQEAIWQLGVPDPTLFNTTDAYYFILLAPPNNYGPTNTATISSNLYNAFEPGDNRKTSWIGVFSITSPDTSYYFPFKYKNSSSDIIEYNVLLRLAEQYLIHAEALVQQNKGLDQAVKDINAIRNRAGLGNYSGPKNQTALLSAIMHERQVELFVEWGHRWFDLIRTGNVDSVMSVVTPIKGGNWKPEYALYPIPQSERNIDFNLTQNPGY
ncbi:MAG: RagB/SusD family nutrient uptake outer membrane protein [Chitinophagaceae bacterium]|nr:RagB/SusD family nutrient uptake outer membrane protein [Chitinophagaceae bacterium]